MVVFHVYNFPHNNQIEVRAEPKNFLVEFQDFLCKPYFGHLSSFQLVKFMEFEMTNWCEIKKCNEKHINPLFSTLLPLLQKSSIFSHRSGTSVLTHCAIGHPCQSLTIASSTLFTTRLKRTKKEKKMVPKLYYFLEGNVIFIRKNTEGQKALPDEI